MLGISVLIIYTYTDIKLYLLNSGDICECHAYNLLCYAHAIFMFMLVLPLYSDFAAVMGHVISTGLQLVGTGSSVLQDQKLASAVRKTVDLAGCQELTAREKQHVKAIELFAKG